MLRQYNIYIRYDQTWRKWEDTNYWTKGDCPTIYIKAVNPPNIKYSEYNFISNATIYVPKESLSLYQNAEVWKEAFAILPIPANVSSVTMTEVETLIVGQEKQLVASVLPIDADNPSLLWESSNEEVIYVNQDGNIKALSSGQSVIRAKSRENPNIFAECFVTVTDTPNGIDVVSIEPTMHVKIYTMTGLLVYKGVYFSPKTHKKNARPIGHAQMLFVVVRI